MKIVDYHELSLMVVNTGYYKLTKGSLLTVVGEFRNTANNVNQMMYHCIDCKGQHHFISRREVEPFELCFTDKGLYAVASSMISLSARLDREVVCYKFTTDDNGVIVSKKQFLSLEYLLGGNENEENQNQT